MELILIVSFFLSFFLSFPRHFTCISLQALALAPATPIMYVYISSTGHRFFNPIMPSSVCCFKPVPQSRGFFFFSSSSRQAARASLPASYSLSICHYFIDYFRGVSVSKTRACFTSLRRIHQSLSRSHWRRLPQ